MYCIQCGHKAEYKICAPDTRSRLTCTHCGYVHYENPKIVTGVLAVFEGKILLCKRAIAPRVGFWTLPAGFMENGESVAGGAARETFEEAQAFVQDLKLYTIVNLPKVGQVHTFYLANVQDGKFGCGEESLECALFNPCDIDVDNLSFESVKITIRQFLQDLQNLNLAQNIKHGNFSDFVLREFVLKDCDNIK